MSPAVTWIMTVRNAMPFLPQTLAAIAAQQFDHPHALFAWDNGSTDGSVDELRRWVPARIPGRVFAGRPLSIGAAAARLIELAPSELCARIDADDIPEPSRLRRQVDFLTRHPDVAAVGSQVTPIDERGLPLAVQREPYYLDHDDIVHQLLYRCALRQPAVMLRRSAVLAVGNYADLQPTEDYDLFLRLAARFKLANMPDRLLRYRYHARSISQNLPDFLRYHREIRSPIFARQAPAVYGLDESTALRLSRRELRCAVPALLRMVGHLERCRRRGFAARLRCESFRLSIEKLIRPGDRLAHWLLRYASSWPRPFAARAARAGGLVAPALPALGQLSLL